MSNFQSFNTYQGPTETLSPSPWQAVRIHDAVNRISSVDGHITETAEPTNARGNSGEVNPYHDTASVLSTARNPNGSPVTEILPTTLVEIGGIQAAVSFWVSEGILQKNQDGTYGEATGKAPEAPAADTSGLLPISDHSMAAINAALETVDQGNLDGLIGVGVGAAVGRLDAATLTRKFGEASGFDSAESHARLTTIKSAFQAQADSALMTRSGLQASDLPEFYAWAKANHQGSLQDAIQMQVRTHDVSGYKALATQWLSSTAPSLNALKAAGLPVREQGQGPEVFVRGQWMAPMAAAKAGLI